MPGPRCLMQYTGFRLEGRFLRILSFRSGLIPAQPGHLQKDGQRRDDPMLNAIQASSLEEQQGPSRELSFISNLTSSVLHVGPRMGLGPSYGGL